MRHLQLRDVGFSVRSATCSCFIVNVLIDDEPVSKTMQSLSR